MNSLITSLLNPLTILIIRRDRYLISKEQCQSGNAIRRSTFYKKIKIRNLRFPNECSFKPLWFEAKNYYCCCCCCLF